MCYTNIFYITFAIAFRKSIKPRTLIRMFEAWCFYIYQPFNDFRLFNDSHFWAYQNNYHIWYKITLINGKIDQKRGFESCHDPLVAGEGLEPIRAKALPLLARLRCPKSSVPWSGTRFWPLRRIFTSFIRPRRRKWRFTPCHEPTRAHPFRGRWFKSST